MNFTYDPLQKQFEEEHQQNTHIIQNINLILMIFGIYGNILCIYVFTQKSLSIRKFNWYLLILAIFELIFCMIIFIDHILAYVKKDHKITTMKPTKFYLIENLDVSNIIIYFIMHTSDAYSMLLTLILSIDRLYAIQYPIKIKHFLTNRCPKTVTQLTFIGLILVQIPGVMFCYTKILLTKNSLNLLYCYIITPLVLNILPALVIIILNVLLTFKIAHEQNFEGLKISKRHLTRTQKSHYCVIIISAFFLLFTSLPYYMMSIYNCLNFVQSTYKLPKLNRNIKPISAILFNSNHCFNFLIYICFHKDFRLCTLKLIAKFCLFQRLSKATEHSESLSKYEHVCDNYEKKCLMKFSENILSISHSRGHLVKASGSFASKHSSSSTSSSTSSNRNSIRFL